MCVRAKKSLLFSTAVAGRRSQRKAQVTLELSISIFLMLLLLVATARIFVWLSSRMVQRQVDYEATAVAAGSVEVSTPKLVCTKCLDVLNGREIQPPDPCNRPYICKAWRYVTPPDSTPGIVDEQNEQDYPKLNIFENWPKGK